MLDPTPEQLRKVRDGARLAGFLPYLDAELDAMGKASLNRAFSLVTSNQLTPEIAQQVVLELYEQQLLRKRLTARVKVGDFVGSGLDLDLPAPQNTL